MPIPPKPYKLVCQKCSYSQSVKPKSDTDVLSMVPSGLCPKCGSKLERKELSKLDTILGLLLKR